MSAAMSSEPSTSAHRITDSPHIAAYLTARGVDVSLVSHPENDTWFAFRFPVDAVAIVSEYNNGAAIEARTYAEALRSLHRRIAAARRRLEAR